MRLPLTGSRFWLSRKFESVKERNAVIKLLQKLWKLFMYAGIEKEEYNDLLSRIRREKFAASQDINRMHIGKGHRRRRCPYYGVIYLSRTTRR